MAVKLKKTKSTRVRAHFLAFLKEENERYDREIAHKNELAEKIAKIIRCKDRGLICGFEAVNAIEKLLLT